ncbi:MAG: hypothetical protein U0869_13040 [Chloroflexota bacterium]
MSERPTDEVDADGLDVEEGLEAEADLDGDDGLGEEEVPVDGDGTIPQDMVLLLAETADLADPVEVVATAEGTTYRLGGRPFAWASGRAFEVQLGPDVAGAALRTPDVTFSARGSGWIRLEPTVIDDHAADRVVAWFEFARRIAAGRQGGGGAGARRH